MLKLNLQKFAATDKRRISHGVKFAYTYAFAAGGATYETGVWQKGLRGVTTEIEQENTIFYADSQAHVVVPGVPMISGELLWYQLEEEYYTSFLGYVANAGTVISDTGKMKPFGFSYATMNFNEVGEETYTIHTLYNVSPLKPSVEKVTDEDSIEAEEIVHGFNASPSSIALDDAGATTTYSYVTLPSGTTEAEVHTLMANIILPTATIPPVPPLPQGTKTTK